MKTDGGAEVSFDDGSGRIERKAWSLAPAFGQALEKSQHIFRERGAANSPSKTWWRRAVARGARRQRVPAMQAQRIEVMRR